MKINNPFADYGGIVDNDRFVGRLDEISIIRNRLIGPTFGNIAIMGLPRIGKSSLAWKAIVSIREELIQQKTIPIWIPFGTYANLNDAFEDILYLIQDELTDPLVKSEMISIERLIIGADTSIEKRRYIKKYLRVIRIRGYRVIIILDEFDNAQRILNVQDFQFLREISYNLTTKVGLLTISRKTVQELEPENGALSNFYQIFTDLRLKMFNAEDLRHYWGRLKNQNIQVSDYYISKLFFYAGNHPFLLDIVNHEVFNLIARNDGTLDEIFTSSISFLKLKIFNEYEAILKLISLEKLEKALVQVIVGPVYDISQREVEKLLKFDILRHDTNQRYISFSPFFTEYLLLKASQIDIWPLWSIVEIEIRNIIKQRLEIQFGQNWVKGYLSEGTIKEQAGRQDFINLKSEMMAKNIKSFGEKASSHMVDYTYPMDMFDRFLSPDWGYFKSIFLKEKVDWRPIFEHLAKIRNPLAHNETVAG